ncbi:MAG: hypothetical protein LQ352_005964, partial [Teloschistes flavicans]
MVPVDHVARCVVACSLHPSSTASIEIAQITAHPRMTFTDFAQTLNVYGYDIAMCSYEQWKTKLVAYVEEQQQQQQSPAQDKLDKEEHALMGLYHFVTGTSPSPAPYSLFFPNPALHAFFPNASKKKPHQLYPEKKKKLIVPGYLPTTTIAPNLSDANTAAALAADSSPSEHPTVNTQTLGR